MWVQLVHSPGHFSVVLARRPNGQPDPDLVMVRARRREHLAGLVGNHASLASAKILATRGTDYPVRLVIPRETWANVLRDEALAVDYTNVKGALDAKLGVGDPLAAAMHAAWGVFRGMDERDDDARSKRGHRLDW